MASPFRYFNSSPKVIRLIPNDGELRIRLKGNLAYMLTFATKDEHSGSPELEV